MTEVIYYISSSNNNPIKDFLDSLSKKQQRKLIRIFTYVQEYGLTTAIPHIKKLHGTPLWEIRILGQDNIRVVYAILFADRIILLHGFLKKKQKTPVKDIQISLERLKDWKARNLTNDII